MTSLITGHLSLTARRLFWFVRVGHVTPRSVGFTVDNDDNIY